MLREELFEILLDLNQFNEGEIKERIWDHFEEEGFSIYADEIDKTIDLFSLIQESDNDALMLSAARIIYKLDLEGVDILGAGLLEDDSRWDYFESILENE